MSQGAIRIDGLSKTYRRAKVPALSDVQLDIRAGESFGVIGPNGAGKTTLMGCLLGFLRPDTGSITVDGLAPDDLAVRAATGYLPERLNFDRWMTGRGFLRLHHGLARRAPAAARAETAATLQAVGLEEAAWDQQISRYSRGMLQRLGFAQALIGRPRFLFLDEPTSGMDPVGVVLIRQIIDQLKTQGVTIVLNSHQLEQVERFCDRVAYVRGGRVESVAVVTAGSEARRNVRLRAAGELPAAGRLTAVAKAAGAEFLGLTPPWARFSVGSDAGAALLVRALIEAGVPVMEVVPDESRLERLFFSESGGAA